MEFAKSAAVVEVTNVPDVDVVVYPIAMEGEVGVYSEESLTIVKRLRSEGITAEYAHDADHRTWLGLNGAVVGMVVLGLATNGAVAAVQSYLTRRRNGHDITLKVARTKEADGSSKEWVEATGSGSAIAEALEALKDDS